MKNLLIENHDLITIVKINRPAALNALNQETLEELLAFLEKDSPNKAMILTGEGEKAFIAGADIKAMEKMNHLEMLRFCELGQKVSLALENAPFLTLAAVNGYALGGGLEMALACDFIYASQSAKLGLPEVSLGIIPGFGGTQRLSRAVGTRLAKEMIMSGKMISAEEGKTIGLVNAVYEPSLLMAESLKTAQSITKHFKTAIVQAKMAINRGYSLGMTEALELERNMCAVSFATKERELAMKAFINKHGEK